MRLLGEIIVRVAVGVDGAVELLEGHEGGDQLIVGVQQAAQPLLRLDVVDVAEDLPTELLTRLEPLQGQLVLRDALPLPVDGLQRVGQVGRGDQGLGDVALHLLLFGFEVERLGLLALLVLLFLARVGAGCWRPAEAVLRELVGLGRRSRMRPGRAPGAGLVVVVFLLAERVFCLPDDFGPFLRDSLLAPREFLEGVSPSIRRLLE